MKLFLKKKVKLEIAADCMLEFMRDEKKKEVREKQASIHWDFADMWKKKEKLYVLACIWKKINSQAQAFVYSLHIVKEVVLSLS